MQKVIVWGPALFIMASYLFCMRYLLRVCFYSIRTSPKGIFFDNFIGKTKFFLWEEIVELKDPFWRMPDSSICVISSNGEKIRMYKKVDENYKKIIELIIRKSPYLTKKPKGQVYTNDKK